MKRTPLKRKTPLKRGAWKRERKPLPQQSASMKAKQAEYRREKAQWHQERIAIDGYHRCEWHDGAGNRCKRHASKNPHHVYGRQGANLIDRKRFMSVCEGPTGHHRIIHDNPTESRQRGFLKYEHMKHE